MKLIVLAVHFVLLRATSSLWVNETFFLLPDSLSPLHDYLRDTSFNKSLKIFYIGDSLQRKTVEAACSAMSTNSSDYFLRLEKKPLCEHEWNGSVSCQRRNLVVANAFLPGVTGVPQGRCERGLPMDLRGVVETTSSAFLAQFGAPDLVVIKSLYWVRVLF